MRRRVGFEFTMLGAEGDVPTRLLIPSGTNTPVGGDLCTVITGAPSYQITTTGTGSTQLLYWLCVEGISEFDILNKPGQHDSDGTDWAYANFGGVSARDGGGTGKRKMFIPLQPDFAFAIEVVDTATAVVMGSSYGLTRVAGSDVNSRYHLDPDNANAAVTVVGIVGADVNIGLGLAAATGTYPGIGAVTNRHAAVLVKAVSATYL